MPEKNSAGTERIVYPDVLRIICIFAVVVQHVAGKNMWTTEAGSYHYDIFTAYVLCARFAVPVFFMISGCFLLDPLKNISIGHVWKKYIARIALVYIVWSAVYSCITVFTAWDFAWSNAFEQLVTCFVAGPYHFWFLFVLAGLYMILPFLRTIVKNRSRQELRYFLLLWFLFSSIIPALQKLNLFSFITSVAISMQVQFVVGFVGLYILGYYLHTFELAKRTVFCIYAFGLIALICSYIFTFYTAKHYGIKDDFWQGSFSITIIPQAAAIFVLFKKLEPRFQHSKKLSKSISSLSKLTFGIYIIHDIFITVLYANNIHTLTYNPLICILPLSIIVFALSAFTTYLIQKIPVLKRCI